MLGESQEAILIARDLALSKTLLRLPCILHSVSWHLTYHHEGVHPACILHSVSWHLTYHHERVHPACILHSVSWHLTYHHEGVSPSLNSCDWRCDHVTFRDFTQPVCLVIGDNKSWWSHMMGFTLGSWTQALCLQTVDKSWWYHPKGVPQRWDTQPVS